MYKNSWTICMTALVAGAFGTFLRWLQGLLAFEAETGLNIRGSIWNYVTAALCVAVSIVFLLICLFIRNYIAPKGLAAAFAGKEPAKKIAVTAAGLLMAVGAIVIFVNSGSDKFPILKQVLAVLAFITGVGYPEIMEGERHEQGSWLACTLSASAMLLFGFWLIVCYKENAEDPIIWDYVVEILAISATAFSFYYFAGYTFGRPRPVHALFFSMLGTFLCMMTLADMRDAGEQTVLIAVVLIQSINTWLLVRNLSDKKIEENKGK